MTRFHDARIAVIRRRVTEHRECCGDKLSYKIVSRALAVYDGLPVASTFAADAAVIMGMSPHDPDYGTNAARMARHLYRSILQRADRRNPLVTDGVTSHEKLLEVSGGSVRESNPSATA